MIHLLVKVYLFSEIEGEKSFCLKANI